MANARVSQQQAMQQRHFTDRPIYDQPSLHPRHGAATAPPDDYYVDDQHVEDYLYSRDHDHDKRQGCSDGGEGMNASFGSPFWAVSKPIFVTK